MRTIRSIGARLFPNPRYYGWAIVGVGFLCSMLSSPGQSFALSLYLEPLMGDLGMSRVQLSSLYAFATLSAALVLPVVGGWADRTTSRRFLTSILVLIAITLLLFSRIRTTVALGAAFFALRLLGQGAIGLGTLTATVRWFRRYRGRALAIVSLGYAFGEMVFPGAIYALIERLGWRGSLVVFAALYLLVFAPAVSWALRERAEDEEPMDGQSAATTDEERAADGAAGGGEYSFTLGETLRTPVFWGLLLSAAAPPMLLTAAIFHQVAIFESQGWSAALVPPAFMAFAVAAVVMTYATGLALERVPSRFGVSASLGVLALAFVAPPLALPATAGSMLYGMLLGLGAGASKASNSILWPDYFGIDALGTIKGVVNAARNGATAAGPPLAAVLATPDGSFGTALAVFAAISAAAALFTTLLRPPAPVRAASRSPGAPGADPSAT